MSVSSRVTSKLGSPGSFPEVPRFSTESASVVGAGVGWGGIAPVWPRAHGFTRATRCVLEICPTPPGVFAHDRGTGAVVLICGVPRVAACADAAGVNGYYENGSGLQATSPRRCSTVTEVPVRFSVLDSGGSSSRTLQKGPTHAFDHVDRETKQFRKAC